MQPNILKAQANLLQQWEVCCKKGCAKIGGISQNVQGAVNNNCKQTRARIKFHIKDSGSDLHAFKDTKASVQTAFELKGNGAARFHSGYEKPDPEALF